LCKRSPAARTCLVCICRQAAVNALKDGGASETTVGYVRAEAACRGNEGVFPDGEHFRAGEAGVRSHRREEAARLASELGFATCQLRGENK
jgi:hypothetical protein